MSGRLPTEVQLICDASNRNRLMQPTITPSERLTYRVSRPPRSVCVIEPASIMSGCNHGLAGGDLPVVVIDLGSSIFGTKSISRFGDYFGTKDTEQKSKNAIIPVKGMVFFSLFLPGGRAL